MKLDRFNLLNTLRCFVTVIDTGSLSASASKLMVSSPAISKQIRVLEAEFGINLFDRKSRNVVPTEAGKKLYQICMPLLNIAKDLKENFNAEIGQIQTANLKLNETQVFPKAS